KAVRVPDRVEIADHCCETVTAREDHVAAAIRADRLRRERERLGEHPVLDRATADKRHRTGGAIEDAHPRPSRGSSSGSARPTPRKITRSGNAQRMPRAT